ncbi:MAG: NADPH-dependent glutamate synthase [Candidatus Izemoplasmataceae bacterium]
MKHQQPRLKMREQDACLRQENFLEVALGYSLEEARQEAMRCIDCKNPRCVAACPVKVKIPEFIKYLLEDALDQAFETIYEDNILPSICGRVCPQESQCEGACILAIKGESVSIGALERFVGDYGMEHNLAKKPTEESNGRKVAVVGSGPAGLANAASLRKKGYEVTIYEALHDFGGVLKYGIPDFRLPKDIVTNEINNLKDLGVKFVKNAVIGKSITIDQLFQSGYEAIFIGSGAGLPSALGVPGENLNGVYYANEFLTRVNLMKSRVNNLTKTPMKLGDNIAVVGGGNVAMDAARTAKRLGAKNVFILYRRDKDSLPARLEEIHHAEEEGIDFRLLTNPVEIIGEDRVVKQVRCEIMKLGEPDTSGRRRPLPTGEYITYDIDNIIISIGQKPNPILKENTIGLDTQPWGGILTNQYQMTSIPGVFAGGDVVTGAATVILAMGAGKDAAHHMHEYLLTKHN